MGKIQQTDEVFHEKTYTGSMSDRKEDHPDPYKDPYGYEEWVTVETVRKFGEEKTHVRSHKHSKKRSLGFNLFWYVPVCIWIFLYFVLQNILTGYKNIVLAWTHLTWGLFISPSAYIFFAVTIASIVLPLQYLTFIPMFFSSENEGLYKKRYLYSFLIIIGIIAAMFLLQIIIWGTFPLDIDKNGYEHLRMIPFFPLPEHSIM